MNWLFTAFKRKNLICFLVPSFDSTDFVLDASSNVEATWAVTDSCNAITSFTVNGYRVGDSNTVEVSVAAEASDRMAVMPSSSFTVCQDYSFRISMANDAPPGDDVLSDRSVVTLQPNYPGSVKYCIIAKGLMRIIHNRECRFAFF